MKIKYVAKYSVLIVESIAFIQPIISKDKKKVCGIKQCADWTAERISFMRSSIDEQCAESDRRVDRICYSVK